SLIGYPGPLSPCPTRRSSDLEIRIEREHYSSAWVPFSVVFKCLTPYGTDTDFVVTSAADIAEDVVSFSGNNLGSVKADPKLIMVFTAANNVSSVKLKNNTNGEEIQVTESFSAGDSLIFDTIQKEVLKNGTPIDFDGFFPPLERGPNDLEITVESTSHSY